MPLEILGYDEANALLEAARLPDADQRLLERTAELPEEMRRCTFALTGRDAQGVEIANHRERERIGAETIAQVKVMSEAERLRLFEALFPKFSREIAYLWDHLFPRISWFGFRPFRFGEVEDVPNDLLWARLRGLHFHAELYGKELSFYFAVGSVINIYNELFAAAIEMETPEGEEIFAALCAKIAEADQGYWVGEFYVVAETLLCSDRLQGWEALLAFIASRQDQDKLGRLLTTIAEGHPEAYSFLMRQMLDRNLLHPLEMKDYWVGTLDIVERATSVLEARTMREIYQVYLENPALRQLTIEQGSGMDLYLALYALAFFDMKAATGQIRTVLQSAVPERLVPTLYFLDRFLDRHTMLLDPEAVFPLLKSPDLLIAMQTLQVLEHPYEIDAERGNYLADCLERLLEENAPGRTRVQASHWPYVKVLVGKNAVTHYMLNRLREAAPQRLLPHMSILGPYAAQWVAEGLGKLQPQDAGIRADLFHLTASHGGSAREEALRALEGAAPDETEALALEEMTAREQANLRARIVEMLLNRSDAQVLESVQRLLATSSSRKRLAALEMLRLMIASARSQDACRSIAEAYRTRTRKINASEAPLLQTLLAGSEKEASL